MIDLTCEPSLLNVLWDELKLLVPKNKIYIYEFAGAIGSGKSDTQYFTVDLLRSFEDRVNDLSLMEIKKLQVRSVREDITSEDTKQAIDDFYSGKSKSPSTLEKIICGKRLQNIIDEIKSAAQKCHRTVIVSDRSLLEDIPFINSLYESCEPCEFYEPCETVEKKKLDNIKENIKNFVNVVLKSGNIEYKVIYLSTDVDVVLKRINKRGRPSESQIDKKSLIKLTYKINDFENEAIYPFVIDNSNISAKGAAILSFLDISSTINWRDKYGYQMDGIFPKTLISFYGVPGSGKTKMSESFFKSFMDASAVGCGLVKDKSEEETIVEEQRKVYESSIEKMSADEIQDFIDRRRIADFCKSLLLHTENKIYVTDIGSETSNIFRKTTKCKKDKRYSEYFDWAFDVHLNVVVDSNGEDKDWTKVREAIKMRGRPAEYEWFTPSVLSEIDSEIAKSLERRNGEADKENYRTTILCKNNYDEESITEVVNLVWEELYYAIVGYKRVTV